MTVRTQATSANFTAISFWYSGYSARACSTINTGNEPMEAHMTMKRVEVEFAETGNEIFVVVDGLRIAKRGRPGTPHANTWVLLEPGWTVRGVWEDGEYAIEIEHNGVRIH
jgi:hypothetical protein